MNRFKICVLFVLCTLVFTTAASATEPKKPEGKMCVAGELLFADDFNPDSVSPRWWFKADFALRDGALLRTDVYPNEIRRIFLKDASFGNTIVQFDFKLAGKTTDLRLVTGSGGGYNSVTQIRPNHFQVNTPVDRDAGIVPSQVGECTRQPRPGKWQTMTVEYWDDEIVAYINDKTFVAGRHPIIDRTRTYFAFQFDLPGAAIDNVRVWKAAKQREDWPAEREVLYALQDRRPAVKRTPTARYQYVYTNLKSRLTLNDKTYRELVAKRDRLKQNLHATYPEAFATHKQLSKRIAKKKKHLKATVPLFKQMETAVHKATRAEDAYVLSTRPELARLQTDGAAKQRFYSELGLARAKLAAANDAKLAELVAETARRQAALEERFPSAFLKVEQAVDERQKVRRALNEDPQFQKRNREVVEAEQAIKAYELAAAPSLAKLAEAARADADSRKKARD